MTEKEKIKLLGFMINEQHRLERRVQTQLEYLLKYPTSDNCFRLALAVHALSCFKQICKSIHVLLKL